MGALKLKDIANHAAAGLAVAGLTFCPMTGAATAEPQSIQLYKDARQKAISTTRNAPEKIFIAIRLSMNELPDNEVEKFIRNIYASRNIKNSNVNFIYEATSNNHSTYSIAYAGRISKSYFVDEVGPELVKHADFISKDRTAVEDLKQILD